MKRLENALPHPLLQRYRAEDLVRLRAPDEHRRSVASQRAGRIDPNPHQIDAVLFALKRIPEGGCILADEVGLGKTIEAGLVIAQLLAEGAERILLITPKALLGQWRQELFELFDITAHEADIETDFERPGVWVITRDFAGGRGADALQTASPFDLIVIDEAHEIFSGIYKRFDAMGNYVAHSEHAKMAGRVYRASMLSPVVLLTATPIQNSLTELWGLAQFVEPTGTLLGSLPTFRQVFCPGDDRRLAEGQDRELRVRLGEICQRTLRRQAQEFMKKPFVPRRAQLFEYTMSAAEKALYDDITSYLLEPSLCAFRGNQRQLLLISFHRQMASSSAALIASLGRVIGRLERISSGGHLPSETTDFDLVSFAEDLDVEFDESDESDESTPDLPRIRAELERVQSFIRRARALETDSKAEALVDATRLVLERGRSGSGSGKLVIFTESLTTQAYLRELLIGRGLLEDRQITLFRGTNEGKRVHEAIESWQAEAAPHLPKAAQPTKEIMTRLALVHEFRTRSNVLISTEAGAKGLNLQFADTLVNYDLPWNPQRIEQRIGRIHRYGQTRQTLIINFLARDNDAQRLTFEILSRKLELFGTVLDASDVVLHESKHDNPATMVGALAADIERDMRRIYDRSRSLEEVAAELAALRESVEARKERFEEEHRRTAGLIESRFDEQVRQAFRHIEAELPGQLAEFDSDLERVVLGYLDAAGIEYERDERGGFVELRLASSPELPEPLRSGARVGLGTVPDHSDTSVESLHLSHPLVRAAVERARHDTRDRLSIRVRSPNGRSPATGRGRLILLRLTHRGYEPVERLLPVMAFEDGSTLISDDAAWIFESAEITTADPMRVQVDDGILDDAIEEAIFIAQTERSERVQNTYRHAVHQIETALEDRLLVLAKLRLDQVARVTAKQALRDAALGAEARRAAERGLEEQTERLDSIDEEIARLRARDDEDYKRWIEQANKRRARAPGVERLLEADFELA